MRISAKFLGLALAASAASAAAPASAAITVSVDGRAQPWLWEDGGLNTNYLYGTLDGFAPVSVNFASAGITAGGSWAIVYKSGLTSAFGGPPTVDQAGYINSPFKNGVLGNSGNPFPSFYMPGEWGTDPADGIFLQALVATFADDNGSIVGTPFPVGYVINNGMGIVFGVGGNPTPFGATRIQLGFNDDIFADNTGALNVCVGTDFDSCFALNAVPEPAPWAMMISGFGLIGGLLRRRVRKMEVRFA